MNNVTVHDGKRECFPPEQEVLCSNPGVKRRVLTRIENWPGGGGIFQRGNWDLHPSPLKNDCI